MTFTVKVLEGKATLVSEIRDEVSDGSSSSLKNVGDSVGKTVAPGVHVY